MKLHPHVTIFMEIVKYLFNNICYMSSVNDSKQQPAVKIFIKNIFSLLIW